MAWALKIAVLLTAIVLIDGKPASSYKDNLVDSNLNKTLEEVAAILGKRPDLPRLTKGELIEIASDIRQQKSLETEDKAPLVVVMPFRPNGTSIEELYTKAPVTQIIGELAAKLVTKRPGYKRRRKPIQRPVYIHTESATETTSPMTTTVSLKPVSNINRVPPRTTTVQPSTTTTVVPWMPIKELAIPENMRDAIEDISVKPATVKPLPTAVPEMRKPTTKSPIPPEHVSVAAESLSDEMKDLLATFGLLDTKKEEPKPIKEQTKDPYLGFDFGVVKPKVDPNSYISFKPLPDSGDDSMSPDMKNFLASFGLISDRTGKSMNPTASSKQKRSKSRDDRTLSEVPKINSEMFSDEGMKVLENLGLTEGAGSRQAKRLGEHIFNPIHHAAELNKTDQIGKAQQLVTKIKEISKNHEIHSLTPNELKELLSTDADLIRLGEDGNLLVRTDSLEDVEGPDPLSLDEIVDLFDKNESKRQQSADGTTITDHGLPISTKRYDNEADVIYTDKKEEKQKEINEDATPEQSTIVIVTSAPDNLLSNNGSAEESTTAKTGSSSSSAASSSLSSEQVASSSTSAAATSSEINAEASASSSSSSSDSTNEDRASSSASASATTNEDDASASSFSASSDESFSPPSSTSTPSDTDSQPMAAEGPSFDDLNESFGGEITTTPRPNGLFFLLDWNSFLQVGQDERKVDLSFNPKIGDPKNFFPIKFP